MAETRSNVCSNARSDSSSDACSNLRSNVYRIPRRFNWTVVVAGFAALALLLMLWRWGGSGGEALAWLDTARWLRGELPASSLRAPFAYQLGLPALAAILPGELRHVFPALNWLFVTAGACLAAATVRRLGFGTQRALVAGLLVIVSLPVAWYAPEPLGDPGSLCMRMLFVFGVLTGQPGIALAAGLAGTVIQEENILLLAWLVALRRLPLPRGLAALAAAAAWLLAVRWWILPGLAGDLPVPNAGAVFALLGDWRTLLMIAACAGAVLPPALLVLLGRGGAPQRLEPLRSLLVLMIVPPLYAALSGQIDGRIAWGLYPFLLPFAAALGLPRDAELPSDVRQLKIVRRA